MPLVLDLRIAHERFGSNSDPSIDGRLNYQNDFDGDVYIVNLCDSEIKFIFTVSSGN